MVELQRRLADRGQMLALDPPGHELTVGEVLVRFESPVARRLAEAAAQVAGGELIDDDEPVWTRQRELQAGLHLHRCPPSACPMRADELRSQGAEAVVGRWARGWLFADVPAPERQLSPLEQRVIDRFNA